VGEMFGARIPWGGGRGGRGARTRACTRRLTCPILPNANVGEGRGTNANIFSKNHRTNTSPPCPCPATGVWGVWCYGAVPVLLARRGRVPVFRFLPVAVAAHQLPID
jgi:hypothetical protein